MTLLYDAVLQNEHATMVAGQRLGQALPMGTVVYLRGQLGAGKTCFSRGLIRSYLPGVTVKSPTYTVVEPYDLDTGSIYHFDLYRLSDPEELEFLGIRDYFNRHSLCLIEWPERGAGLIPEPDLIAELVVLKQGTCLQRQLKIEPLTERGRLVVENLLEQQRA